MNDDSRSDSTRWIWVCHHHYSLRLCSERKADKNGESYTSASQPGLKDTDVAADSMQLDDSKSKVYIYNIDDELSSAESEEEKLVFLPDIEKRLTKIPKSVLTNGERPATSSEMILYNVPQSLSIPQEQDNVRKAIIETRARAQKMQAKAAWGAEINSITAPDHRVTPQVHEDHTVTQVSVEVDEDAMDLG